MHDLLKDADLFQGFTSEGIRRLSSVGRARTLAAGDYLFLLGDRADCLYVVASGVIELCLPMSIGGRVKDVPVESVTAGKALGWSALVKPYRFTLSARAAEPGEVIAFDRRELEGLFDAAPDVGSRFLANLLELVGFRLLTFQTLWVRELQQAVLARSPRRAPAV